MTKAMPGFWYASLEDVKAALDVKFTARTDAQVKRALESSSNTVEAQLHRRFYPWTGTRYFDWPNYQYARSWRLWLDSNELISATTVVAGTATIAATDYFLRRSDDLDEPPYTHVEIDLASQAAFSSANGTHQRSIAITGVFGACADETTAGTITANVTTTTATTVSISDSSQVGVGNLIRVDNERMVITGKAMADTGQTSPALTASVSDQTLTGITAGTVFVDEVLLLDSERMLVVDIAGTSVTVKRQHDGTTLAAHSLGTHIYAPRTLTVLRGQAGTTAATHTSAAVVYRHTPPGLIGELQVAEAINTMLQRQSGYARTTGAGENERESSGRGLSMIRMDAYTAFGRQARKAAV